MRVWLTFTFQWYWVLRNTVNGSNVYTGVIKDYTADEVIIQGVKINMAVFFWYFVKCELTSVLYCTVSLLPMYQKNTVIFNWSPCMYIYSSIWSSFPVSLLIYLSSVSLFPLPRFLSLTSPVSLSQIFYFNSK